MEANETFIAIALTGLVAVDALIRLCLAPARQDDRIQELIAVIHGSGAESCANVKLDAARGSPRQCLPVAGRKEVSR